MIRKLRAIAPVKCHDSLNSYWINAIFILFYLLFYQKLHSSFKKYLGSRRKNPATSQQVHTITITQVFPQKDLWPVTWVIVHYGKENTKHVKYCWTLGRSWYRHPETQYIVMYPMSEIGHIGGE